MTDTSSPNIYTHPSEFIKLSIHGYANFSTNRIKTWINTGKKDEILYSLDEAIVVEWKF